MVSNIETSTNYSTSIIAPSLETEIFVVGPNTTLKKIPQLTTSNASLDIDLIGISMHNKGSAAVAFLNYANISHMLKPQSEVKTMMSTVVTIMLPQLNSYTSTKSANDHAHDNMEAENRNEPATQPDLQFNFSLKNPVGNGSNIACMTWTGTEWVKKDCRITKKHIDHTECRSPFPGTFALLMELDDSVDEGDLIILNTIAESVGMVFLSLTLMTFALFHGNLRVTNPALINLCISLLLAHLLFLLTQQFLQYIQPNQPVCAGLAGVLHFLFLSAFVWMFIEAVLLFNIVRNLTKIRSKQKEVLGWKCLIIIGYVIALVIVCVSAGLVPGGYGSKQCWLKKDGDFIWSFLGPVCFVLTSNVILFLIIVVNVTCTLKNRNSEVFQHDRTANDLLKSVMLKTLSQFFILGCPWILGFFTNIHVVKILFLFLNSQQGTFIFLIHCVLNREIRQQYRRFFCGLCTCNKSVTKSDGQNIQQAPSMPCSTSNPYIHLSDLQ